MEPISGITGTIVAPRSDPNGEIVLGELDRFNLRCRRLFLSNPLLFIGLIQITAWCYSSFCSCFRYIHMAGRRPTCSIGHGKPPLRKAKPSTPSESESWAGGTCRKVHVTRSLEMYRTCRFNRHAWINSAIHAFNIAGDVQGKLIHI
jgi:hypothetical protein